MTAKVYGVDGTGRRDIELADEVFNRTVSTGSIYHAIRNELANLRVGTASSKSRSEVRGSGTKPWRQKGTGRARAGTRQSPLWVGGGVVFGPKPRDYSYTVPRKLKRLAFRSILSQKAQEQRLMVVEDFTVESGKTRELVKILKVLSSADSERITIVISGEDAMLKRAGRNIPGLSILSYNRLRAHDLFYSEKIIVFEKAAEELGRFYGSELPRRQRPAKAASSRQPGPVQAPKPPAGKKAAAAKPVVKKAAKDSGTAKPAVKKAAKDSGTAKPVVKKAAKDSGTAKPAAPVKSASGGPARGAAAGRAKAGPAAARQARPAATKPQGKGKKES